MRHIINKKGVYMENNKAIQEQLDTHTKEAAELLKDKDKTEKKKKKIEEKLKTIKGIGPFLGEIPVLISLLRAYIRKEYTQFPFISAVALMGALLYFVNPFDVVPDAIIGAGLVDDAVAISIIIKMMETDLAVYKEWKKEHYKD